MTVQAPKQVFGSVERGSHVHPEEITGGPTLSVGTRAAGVVAAVAGSWIFIIGYLVFTLVYTVGHKAGILHFDPYPFQFYTFLVSVLAILLAQIILLFQNQQARIETHIAHNAYHQVAEIDAVQQTQLEILQQLRTMMIEMRALEKTFDRHVDKTGSLP